MKNLIFMLWMLLYPLVTAFGAYLYGKVSNRVVTAGSVTAALVVEIATWMFVGYLLYER